jgi:hypothetical protein
MQDAIKFAPPFPPEVVTERLIARVSKMDCRHCRLELAKIRMPSPKKYPRFRYKYMPLASANIDSIQQQSRIKKLRDIILEGRFWLSSPRHFNDPFDMTAHVVIDGTTKQLRARVRELIEERSTSQWKKRREEEGRFMALDRTELLKRLRRSFEVNIDSTGVFAFAGTPRSGIMWSHYAEQHSGICLQFEICKDPASMVVAVPVQYDKEYPIINWTQGMHERIAIALRRKFEDWKYEDEWRIIWPNGAGTYLPFKPAALVGVILGYKADDGAVRNLESILEERKKRGLSDVTLYRAAMHERRYAMRIWSLNKFKNIPGSR